jgi:hypothetical protein
MDSKNKGAAPAKATEKLENPGGVTSGNSYCNTGNVWKQE